MAFQTLHKDLTWIAPLSLGLGAALEWGTWLAIADKAWWVGWLAYTFLLCAGQLGLVALWRNSDAGQAPIWPVVIGIAVRLGLGVALTFLLPLTGYGTPSEQAGYLFPDAFLRDQQAWDLATSSYPLWQAFHKSYSADPYGGLLFLMGLLYRYLSPDAHRPWLPLLLAALIYGSGILFGWKAGRILLGEKGAALTAWLLALYPESILSGASQMREPFLIAFTALFLWGALDWTAKRRLRALVGLFAGLTGLVLFSPGVAIAALLITAAWLWAHRRDGRWPRRLILLWTGALLAAALLFWSAVAASPSVRGGVFQAVADWFRFSAKYDIYFLERSSGWLQRIFEELPPALHMPFMTAYGLAQPVLPAILTVCLFPDDPTNWTLNVLGILRAAGWYALAPFLLGSLLAARRIPDKKERFAWLWIWGITLTWIVLASYRAGGDQWDNPRYRSILLLWQVLLAARSWLWWRETRSREMRRILLAEGIFLALFLYWYLARYTGWREGQVHVFVILLLFLLLVSIGLLGACLRDRKRARQSPPSSKEAAANRHIEAQDETQ